MKWSPQQLAFLEWCQNDKGSCLLEARAGTGKSTTLVEAARVMPGQVALLAFNKAAGADLKAKLKQAGVDWKKAQAGTVHSFGYAALRKWRNADIPVTGDKVFDLAKTAFPELSDKDLGTLCKLVSLAKQRAIGIESDIDDESLWEELIEHFSVMDDDDEPPPVAEPVAPTETTEMTEQERRIQADIERGRELSERADAATAFLEEAPEPEPEAMSVGKAIRYSQLLLKKSNDALDTLDFDDMIYLPLLYKPRMWQFDVVMIDEAQDTNAARRLFVRALVRPRGRVIACGDRWQAIYGFTGADADALDQIAHTFNMIRMPLTISYRCPKAVIRFAHQWVDDIEAAPEAPDGWVGDMPYAHMLGLRTLDKDCAILCRNTQPLIATAFTLIRARVPCKVEGRDIGNGLRSLATRWKTATTLDDLEMRVFAYLAQQKAKLAAKKQTGKMQDVEDRVETLRVIIERCREEGKRGVQAVLDYIKQLFADDVTDMLVLSTIHKAKGREWQTVFWLDRQFTCPSIYAEQPWEKAQERNLQYVAATRSKSKLVEVNRPPPPRRSRSKDADDE